MAPALRSSTTSKESRIASSTISTVGICDLNLEVMEKSRSLVSKLTEKSQEDLPLDGMCLIFATLEVPDLVRTGSVCSSWRAAYTSLCNSGSCKPQQTPCLLYTSESACERAVCLYSLTEKKTYTLTLPDPPVRSRHIIGSSYGWIVTADEMSELHIVNPITGDRIVLPSVTTIKQVTPIFNDTGAVCSYKYYYSAELAMLDTPYIVLDDLSELRDFLFYKAFLSSDPSTRDYFAVLIHRPQGQLSFARAGDDKWTWLPIGSSYNDCLFNGQMLYASTKVGEIHEFDLGTPAVTHRIFFDRGKEIYDDTIYVVQSSCGELLQLWRPNDYTAPQRDEEDEYDSDFEPELDPESPVYITSMIKAHKVEPTSKNLVGISSLGGNVLFLGHNQSLCLDAEEYPQLKANHVYFTDDWPYNVDFKNRRRDIGVFDLECNSSDEIVSQFWSNWPAPVWLVPNTRQIDLSLCK